MEFQAKGKTWRDLESSSGGGPHRPVGSPRSFFGQTEGGAALWMSGVEGYHSALIKQGGPMSILVSQRAVCRAEIGWDLGPFAAVLQGLHLDTPLLQQQNTKKLYGTKITACMHS